MCCKKNGRKDEGMGAKKVARVALGVVALALAVAAILATPGYAQKEAESSGSSVPNYQYKLTETGEYKGDKSALRFYDGYVVIETEGGYQIIGTDGELVLDGKVFTEFEYLSHGVYEVQAPVDGVNKMGLVRADGTELLPCEAAMFDHLTNDSKDSRFIEVVYSEGETENKDAAFCCAHEGAMSLATSTPGYGDTLYKGYARIFDLKKGSFVEGIEIRDAHVAASAHDLGDAFTLRWDNATKMYNADGKVIWSKDGSVSVYPRFVTWSDGGKTQVFDASGKGRYTSTETLDNFMYSYGWWSDDYLAERSNALYKIMDFDGKQVLPKLYSNIAAYDNGLFVLKEKENDEAYKVLGADGTVVTENGSSSIFGLLPNYTVVSKKDNSYGVAKGTKLIWEGDLHLIGIDYLAVEKGGKVLTLNDEKFSLELEPKDGLFPALISGRSEDNATYGVYDLFTGKQLLKDEYEVVESGDDCVWTYANDTWTIYSVELEEL